MKLLLDVNACQTASRHRGIGRYALNFCRKIIAQAPHDEIHLLGMQTLNGSDRLIEKELCPNLPRNRFKTIELPERPRAPHTAYPSLTDCMQELSLQAAYTKFQADVIHCNSLFEDEVTPPPPSKWGARVTSTILYDLIPLLFPTQYLHDPVAARNYREKLTLLKEADLLLAISECTKADAIRELGIDPARIVNISAACDPCFLASAHGSVDARPLLNRVGILRPFLFYIGNVDHRKNLAGLIRAYARVPLQIRRQHQLVVTCPLPGNTKHQLREIASKHELSDTDIIFTGNLDDRDLVVLYQSCHAFVFPSLYEGFGLPVLEAMSCGAPVIAANNSSLPEILRRSDALFDPNNEEAFTSAMNRVLQDRDYRHDLINYGKKRALDFSWENSAKIAYSAWVSALETRTSVRKNTPSTRKKIAFVKPANPQTAVPVELHDLTPELLAKSLSTPPTTPYENDAIPIYAIDKTSILASREFHSKLCAQPGFLHIPGDVATEISAISKQAPSFHPTERDLIRHTCEASLGVILSSRDAALHFQPFCPTGLPLYFTDLEKGAASEALSDFIQSACERHAALNPAAAPLPLLNDPLSRTRVDTWLRSLVDTAPQFRPSRIYVDITQFRINWNSGLRTGIERVITKTVEHMLQAKLEVWLVELASNGCDFASVVHTEDNQYQSTANTVRFQRGDILLIPEIRCTLRSNQSFWDRLHRAGVEIHAIVYDILFTRLPQYFPQDALVHYHRYLEAITVHADRLHTISKAVADELVDWLQSRPNRGRRAPLMITPFPLGADIEAEDAPATPPHDPDFEHPAPTFLSVGTLEPRKGHGFTLDAFELLWARGTDVRLCIVGRTGWMVENTVTRIRNHPELNKRLYWLNDADDAQLRYCYRHADALINASAGEGFGLPLVEAARHKIPIIASRLPVFMEVCGEGALYFERNQPSSLASCIDQFLEQRATGNLPDIAQVKSCSWQESTRALLAGMSGSCYVEVDGDKITKRSPEAKWDRAASQDRRKRSDHFRPSTRI